MSSGEGTTAPPLRIVAILGPTASGKTRLAVDLAHQLGSEILSADARQVYRGLDLGTGKDLDEYRRVSPAVPVHLLDVVEVEDVYTLGRYLDDCAEVLEAAINREPFASGTPLVVCGGSGLYAEALLRNYDVPRVPPNPILRAELEASDHTTLVARLQALDPELAARTDLSTHRRVVRGLEIATATAAGTLLASKPRPSLDVLTLVVADPDTAALALRIRTRLAQRLAAGMLEEVRQLLDRGVPRSRLDELGLEYRELAAVAAGERSLEDGTEGLARAILAFAKRQRTWFRGMPRRGLATIEIAPGDWSAALALTRERWSGIG